MMNTTNHRAAARLRWLMLLSLTVIGSALLSPTSVRADAARMTEPQGVHAGVRVALAGEKDKGSIREENAAKVQQATATLAKGIRSNNSFADRVVGKLDGKDLAAFRKYSKQIVDKLLDIAGIPDLSTRVVKAQIVAYLVQDLSVSMESAILIGAAIEGGVLFAITFI